MTNVKFNIRRKMPHILRNIEEFFFGGGRAIYNIAVNYVLYLLPLCLLPRKPFHEYGVTRDVKNFIWSLYGKNVVKRRCRQKVAGQMWAERGRTLGTALTNRPTLQPDQRHTQYKNDGSFSATKWPSLCLRGLYLYSPRNIQ